MRQLISKNDEHINHFLVCKQVHLCEFEEHFGGGAVSTREEWDKEPRPIPPAR